MRSPLVGRLDVVSSALRASALSAVARSALTLPSFASASALACASAHSALSLPPSNGAPAMTFFDWSITPS
jgi:hypothetical protein